MRSISCGIIIVFSLTLWTACRPAAAPVSVSNVPISVNGRPTTNLPMPPTKPMEEMSWNRIDGAKEKLKDLQGKAVILDFWATYCPPCIEEIPHLNSLQAKYGVENLQVVGLNIGGSEDRPLIPEFSARLKIAYPIGFPDDELNRFIFATRDDIPQTAVFDRKGRLVTKIIGFSPTIQKELDAAVETAVASQ